MTRLPTTTSPASTSFAFASTTSGVSVPAASWDR